jgi:hypothetical protein
MSLNVDTNLRLKCFLKCLELAEKTGSTDLLGKAREFLAFVENREAQPGQAEISLTPTDAVEVFVDVVERVAKKAGVSTAAILSTTVKLPKVGEGAPRGGSPTQGRFSRTQSPRHRDAVQLLGVDRRPDPERSLRQQPPPIGQKKMSTSVVYRNGVEFEFPQQVMVMCRLRPHQNLTGEQFLRALTLHAEFQLGRRFDMDHGMVREL